MTSYRALVCQSLGLDGLLLTDMERQPLRPGEVRIRIEAAGVNFPDLLMVQGLYQYKPALPFVSGMEAAGRVIAAGGGCSFAAGEAVVVGAKTGAFAEEIVASEPSVRPLPKGMTMEEGATFSVAFLTAYHGLKTRGHVVAGETVLVLGAAGGVGAAAIQVGKALGARIIAAASTTEKMDFARALGADEVVNYRDTTLEKEVARLTDGRGVDAVFDPVGWLPESLCRCVAFGGRILIVGFAGGSLPSYPANRLLLKGASLIGVRAGEAGRHDPAARVREWHDILDFMAAHALKPKISERIPLVEFRRAFEAVAQRRALGRIVLIP